MLKSLIIVVTFFVLIGININAFCQTKTFDPHLPIQNVSLSQWTTDQGLPSNNITGVLQDSNGLIWTTSYNGFMVFNGEQVDVYDANNLSFLETDGFYTVVEGDDKVMYLGSQGSGIIMYDRGVFSQYKPKGASIPKSLRSLMFASTGELYIGTSNDGLFIVKNDSCYKVDFPGLDQAAIRVIEESPNGSIWIGTGGKGMFVSRMGQFKHLGKEDGLMSNIIVSLITSPSGVIYIGTSRGLQWFEDGSFFNCQYFTNTYINCLLFDDWNTLWVGTEVNIGRWHIKEDRVEYLVSKRGVDLVRVSDMVRDGEGSIWVTSNRSGLMLIKESLVANRSIPELSSNRVYIVHESWDGSFYVGTDLPELDIFAEGKTVRCG